MDMRFLLKIVEQVDSNANMNLEKSVGHSGTK